MVALSRLLNMESNNSRSETCGVLFDKTSKKRKRAIETTDESLLETDSERVNNITKDNVHVAKRQGRPDSTLSYDPTSAFKNLRVPHAPDPMNTRDWTDTTGSFKFEAELIGVSWFDVFLHTMTGLRISIPFDKLADVDQEFILSLPEVPWVSKLTISEWRHHLEKTGQWPGNAGSYAAGTGFLGFRNVKVELREINNWKILVDVSRVSTAFVNM
jgi:hypothetical protein